MGNLLFKFFCIFLIFNFTIISKKINGSITHPIKIIINSSKLQQRNQTHQYLLKFLNNSCEMLSKMVNTINNKNILVSSETLETKCQIKLKIEKKEKKYYNGDLIVFPFIENVTNSELNVIICDKNYSNDAPPSVIIFKMNSFLSFYSSRNSPEKEYLLTLKMLKCLLDGLGLDPIFELKTGHLKNNYYSTPKYLIENTYTYKSIQKIYKLYGEKMPKVEVSDIADFYLSEWNEDSIIKDFRSERIDIRYDMSEASFNLLNDMQYYVVSKCDLILDDYGKCHRVDQKCISNEEFQNKYYLKYGVFNSKIICYFSHKNNILKKQCGNKYGPLIKEVINYSPLIRKYEPIKKKLNYFEIPELQYIGEQELTLIAPYKKCHAKMPRTIFFKTENISPNFYNLNDIVLSKKNKKFFATFQTRDILYLNFEFIVLAKANGLIRSYIILGNHNLILDFIPEEKLKQKGENQIMINKYQKIFNYVGSNIFHNKESLYSIYLKQQNLFKNDYNYMLDTYIYPKDKDKIYNDFKDYKIKSNNLWIIKQKEESTNAKAHFFKSLKNIPKEFVMSKYLTNPHLIDGKKYHLRLYVLVSGIKPLRIYLYNEGFAHIAKNKFSLDKKYFDNKRVHLTNSIANNKKNFYFINEKAKNNTNKMNLFEYRNYLKKENIDYNLLREKLIDTIIKTVISGHEYLLSKLDEYNLNDRSFFNLFGYDFIVDSNYDPYLLKVSKRPDLSIRDKVDKAINEKIFIDTLNIIGIIPFSHDEKGEPLDEVYKYDSPVNELVEDAFCELTRPKGSYDLIFPLKKNIDEYKKFFRKKLPENELFWKKINNDNEDYLNFKD